MYYTALSEIEIDNYSVAEYGFKQIITDYPDNKYAQASLKGLFALNSAINGSDFSDLKLYCDSLTLNPGDSLLGTTADWISIHCDIKDQHFQPAINSLDSIISNPGTLADSVFAMIDLNYVYLKTLDSSNLKSACITKNENILAKSHENYIVKRKDWIELLFKETNGAQNNDPVPPSYEEDLSVIILSVYPNPAQNILNINYHVSIPGRISLSVCNLMGQELNQYDFGWNNSGDFTESISLAPLPKGIYFLSLSLDGMNYDARKIVIRN
jgi:hypothetical protein